jgi:paraquat-inducible protein A
MTAPVMTARQAGLVACSHCSRVSARTVASCPRCGGRLHGRKVESLSRSTAYLIAAAILYIPANLLPVMQTSTLLGVKKDTILSGIIYFWTSGSWGLAALIFFVSILVPMLKLGTIALLTLSVHFHWGHHLHQRARLFHIIEMVGRWSMLDIFVVALMAGLVHFRGVALIEAGAGAAAFGAVVVLTILASQSFDPRLIWDRQEELHD